MSTFQTLLALVVLIFVWSVIVQAAQGVFKSLLKTKHLALGVVWLTAKAVQVDLDPLPGFVECVDFRFGS